MTSQQQQRKVQNCPLLFLLASLWEEEEKDVIISQKGYLHVECVSLATQSWGSVSNPIIPARAHEWQCPRKAESKWKDWRSLSLDEVSVLSNCPFFSLFPYANYAHSPPSPRNRGGLSAAKGSRVVRLCLSQHTCGLSHNGISF